MPEHLLSAGENRAEAAEILRSPIERVVLTRNGERKLDVDFYGDPAEVPPLASN
jgi:hypothetical protein